MSQRGFTLIEILVAMAVAGVVATAVVPAIFQMVVGTGRSNGAAVALADLDRGAHWINRDVVLAQTTDLEDSAPPVSAMTLSWDDLTAWATLEGTLSHSITYTLTGPNLQRDYDGQVTTVAKHLTKAEFSINGRTLTVTLTSSPGSFTPRTSETRTYDIYLRTQGQ
ncbi:MAG: prepilin-type N-terminal cleavage/methylation domain-containing protein [Chloroflexi bacterium]|nr:prepilin-type N-terminal cleavage/methylation domain-containing protein [Chloroflexota bacterium]